jgi:hypothetical protein
VVVTAETKEFVASASGLLAKHPANGKAAARDVNWSSLEYLLQVMGERFTFISVAKQLG